VSKQNEDNGSDVCGVVGVMLGVSWTLGPLIGGPIVTRLKMNRPRTLAVIVIIKTIVCLGYLSAMLLDCPEAQWVGSVTQEGLRQRSLYC